MDNADLTLIVSAVLTLATIVLAVFTIRLWRETKIARRPRIVAALDIIAPDYGELRIVNAGTGAAVDVDVFFAPAGGQQRRWADSVVLSGEGENFNLLSHDEEAKDNGATKLDGFITQYKTVEVHGTYRDVQGRKYRLQQNVDVETQWTEARDGNRLRAFRGPMLPFYQLLRETRDALRGIKSLAEKADRRARNS